MQFSDRPVWSSIKIHHSTNRAIRKIPFSDGIYSTVLDNPYKTLIRIKGTPKQGYNCFIVFSILV